MRLTNITPDTIVEMKRTGQEYIAYIMETFPSPTEYFILNEILALGKHDIRIVILSIRKPRLSVEISGLADLKAPVFYSSPTSYVKFFNVLRCYKKLSGILSDKRCFHTRSVGKKWRYLLLSLGFEKRLSHIRVKHIHAHFAFIASDVGYMLSKLLDVKFSFTAHAQDIFLNKQQIIKKIEIASFVLTCTRYNEQYLKQLTGNKFDDKIYHVYHGIDVNEYAVRKKTCKDDNVIRVLSVARLIEKKGIIYLLKAIKILTEQEINVACTIVGEGPLKKELACFVDKAGIGCYVNFSGVKSRNDVLTEMSGADIFVLSSIVAANGDIDGLPNVLLEAINTGVPVISTSVSAITELIEHEITGIIVPEKDEQAIAGAILTLARDRTLYQFITARARKRVINHFDIGASTQKLIHLFNRYTED
jgi:colanic acid/amylovoran biosynthesis glycosyltransferase